MTSSVSSSVAVSTAVGAALASDRAAAARADLWLKILREIEPKLQRMQFITWFKDTTILGIEEGKLVVGLSLPMSLNWHLEHYQTMTLQIAKSFAPSVSQIVYKVDGSLKGDRMRCADLLAHFPEKRQRKLPGKQEVKMAEGVVSKIFNPKYTLENFVVGAGNRLAHAACQAVATEPGGKYNPLFIYGGVGLGKTHLLQGVGQAILKRMPQCTVVYTTTEDFTNQVVTGIRSQRMEDVRRRYRNVDVLIVDDIQFIATKDRTQEEFFHTFNTLYEGRKQLVISADRRPEDLQLDKRLSSRFERGMIADVAEPDYETRLAILMEKAQEYRIFIDMSVLQFIAEHTTKNVRELEGVLMQAVAQYELEQRMPTIHSIADIMAKLRKDPLVREEKAGFDPQKPKRATLEEIIEAVSSYYTVAPQELIGASRVREILVPRQIAMYLAQKHLRIPYMKLGEVFSGRDHTTVINACRKIVREMQVNAHLLREVRALETDLHFR